MMGKETKDFVLGGPFKQLKLIDRFVALLFLSPRSKLQVLSDHRKALNSTVTPVKGLEGISNGPVQSNPHFNKK